jgi:hypothetical protein
MKIVNKKGFTKVYRMAGNGFVEWHKTLKASDARARKLYKGTGQPWYGRTNAYFVGSEVLLRGVEK